MKSFMYWRVAFALVLLALAAPELLATTATPIYVVGSCKPSSQSFKRIQDALNFNPPPATVLVCPGTYNEQVTITQPVTLQGIVSGNGDQAVIAIPAGGVQGTIDADGGIVNPQVYVNNAPGPVSISNLTIDGTGSGVIGQPIVGIFFQNSPGSVTRVTTANQTGDGNGYGIWVEGGSANPTVTVSNNSVRAFDGDGIESETFGAAASELTATISGNRVDATASSTGIGSDGGATTTITGNIVGNVREVGIETSGLTGGGTISGNTVVGTTGGAAVGIVAGNDGISVVSNKTFDLSSGISVGSAVVVVKSNNIMDSTTGMDFECTANPNVSGNTIIDAATGINNVPMGVATSNSYSNVASIRSQGTCH